MAWLPRARGLCVRPGLASVVLLAAAAGWVFTGEIGIFYYRSLQWKWPGVDDDLSMSARDPENGHGTPSLLKLLVLSDPHIQCNFNRYEPWVARWDSDHYVRKSFSLLMRRLVPDVVIVLGDVFAEGFKASKEEWSNYLQVRASQQLVPGRRCRVLAV